MDKRYLLLIDGSSLLSTQFFGNLPREILFAKTMEEKEKYFHKIMMTRKGVYTNGVFGFLRTLFKILREQKPDYLAVSWDLTRNTFRKELYADYKGNRSETMVPLKEQFALMQEVLKRMHIPQFMDERYEADDFCGSLSTKFEKEIPIKILTKDNDYLQLVTENTHLWLMHSSQDKTEALYKKYNIDPNHVNVPDRAFEFDPELVLMEFGVGPECIHSLKGLQGDSSDNIKGVPGVGGQTAVKLIAKYKTIENLYSAIEGLDASGVEALKKEWKEELGITRSPLKALLKESDEELVGKASALLSEKLATIKRDIDLSSVSLEDLKLNIDREATNAVMEELEFNSLQGEFLSSEEEQPKYEIQPRIIKDLPSLEKWIPEFKKEKHLGVFFDARGGFAIAKENGECFGLTESFFMNRETFANVVNLLANQGITLYTTNFKGILALTEADCVDVSVAAYLLNPLQSSYGYEDIGKEYLQTRFPSFESLFKKASSESLKWEHQEEFGTYCCYEAFAGIQAGKVLVEKLKEKQMDSLFFEVEMPLTKALFHMEKAGIQVQDEALKIYGLTLKEKIDTLSEEIYDLTGEEFNINSPKQLGVVLFEKLQLPFGKKTKSGYSTSADVLDKLAPEYPVVSKILEYRTYSKLYSTYAEGLRKFIGPDGRIHGEFNQTVTATGRISSTNPNLQNIPARMELGKLVRKVFVPKEGCVFVDADYSQIELRILAHLSGDQNLIHAYNEAKDIHAITASQVFHVPLDEVTPLQRRNAKAVNFGIVYGISAFGLSEDLSITRKEAAEYIQRYFETYPGIEGYLKDTVETAKKLGYTTTMFHRIRPIPELESTNGMQRAFGERAAMNSPIQGTAADIMKIAMIRVEKALKEENLKSRIVLQVHDELLIEALEEEADLVSEILVREMEHAVDLDVKLEVEVTRGNSWYECK